MTRVTRIRLFTSVVVFLIVLFLGWYGGVDYLQRGFDGAWFVAVSIAAAWGTWSFPGWKK